MMSQLTTGSPEIMSDSHSHRPRFRTSVKITDFDSTNGEVEEIVMTEELIQFLVKDPVCGRSDYTDLPGAKENARSSWRSFASYPLRDGRQARQRPSRSSENAERLSQARLRRAEVARKRKEQRQKQRDQSLMKKRERRRQKEIIDRLQVQGMGTSDSDKVLSPPGLIISNPLPKTSPVKKILGPLSKRANSISGLQHKGKKDVSSVKKKLFACSSSEPVKDSNGAAHLDPEVASHIDDVINEVVNTSILYAKKLDIMESPYLPLPSPSSVSNASTESYSETDIADDEIVFANEAEVSSSSRDAPDFQLSNLSSTKVSRISSKSGNSCDFQSASGSVIADADSSTAVLLNAGRRSQRRVKKINYAELLDGDLDDISDTELHTSSSKQTKPIGVPTSAHDASENLSCSTSDIGQVKSKPPLESNEVSSSVVENAQSSQRSGLADAPVSYPLHPSGYLAGTDISLPSLPHFDALLDDTVASVILSDILQRPIPSPFYLNAATDPVTIPPAESHIKKGHENQHPPNFLLDLNNHVFEQGGNKVLVNLQNSETSVRYSTHLNLHGDVGVASELGSTPGESHNVQVVPNLGRGVSYPGTGDLVKQTKQPQAKQFCLPTPKNGNNVRDKLQDPNVWSDYYHHSINPCQTTNLQEIVLHNNMASVLTAASKDSSSLNVCASASQPVHSYLRHKHSPRPCDIMNAHPVFEYNQKNPDLRVTSASSCQSKSAESFHSPWQTPVHTHLTAHSFPQRVVRAPSTEEIPITVGNASQLLASLCTTTCSAYSRNLISQAHKSDLSTHQLYTSTHSQSPLVCVQNPITHQHNPFIHQQNSLVHLQNSPTHQQKPLTHLQSPFTHQLNPHIQQKSPLSHHQNPHTDQQSPLTYQQNLHKHLKSLLTHQQPTHLRSPFTHQQNPHTHRKSPLAHQQDPHNQRRSPLTGQQNPHTRLKSPLTHQQNPHTRLKSPHQQNQLARQQSPFTHLQNPHSQQKSPLPHQQNPHIQQKSPLNHQQNSHIRLKSPPSNHQQNQLAHQLNLTTCQQHLPHQSAGGYRQAASISPHVNFSQSMKMPLVQPHMPYRLRGDVQTKPRQTCPGTVKNAADISIRGSQDHRGPAVLSVQNSQDPKTHMVSSLPLQNIQPAGSKSLSNVSARQCTSSHPTITATTHSREQCLLRDRKIESNELLTLSTSGSLLSTAASPAHCHASAVNRPVSKALADSASSNPHSIGKHIAGNHSGSIGNVQRSLRGVNVHTPGSEPLPSDSPVARILKTEVEDRPSVSLANNTSHALNHASDIVVKKEMFAKSCSISYHGAPSVDSTPTISPHSACTDKSAKSHSSYSFENASAVNSQASSANVLCKKERLIENSCDLMPKPRIPTSVPQTCTGDGISKLLHAASIVTTQAVSPDVPSGVSSESISKLLHAASLIRTQNRLPGVPSDVSTQFVSKLLHATSIVRNQNILPEVTSGLSIQSVPAGALNQSATSSVVITTNSTTLQPSVAEVNKVTTATATSLSQNINSSTTLITTPSNSGTTKVAIVVSPSNVHRSNELQNSLSSPLAPVSVKSFRDSKESTNDKNIAKMPNCVVDEARQGLNSTDVISTTKESVPKAFILKSECDNSSSGTDNDNNMCTVMLSAPEINVDHTLSLSAERESVPNVNPLITQSECTKSSPSSNGDNELNNVYTVTTSVADSIVDHPLSLSIGKESVTNPNPLTPKSTSSSQSTDSDNNVYTVMVSVPEISDNHAKSSVDEKTSLNPLIPKPEYTNMSQNTDGDNSVYAVVASAPEINKDHAQSSPADKESVPKLYPIIPKSECTNSSQNPEGDNNNVYTVIVSAPEINDDRVLSSPTVKENVQNLDLLVPKSDCMSQNINSSNNVYTVTVSLPESNVDHAPSLSAEGCEPPDLTLVKDEYSSNVPTLNLREVIDVSDSDSDDNQPTGSQNTPKEGEIVGTNSLQVTVNHSKAAISKDDNDIKTCNTLNQTCFVPGSSEASSVPKTDVVLSEKQIEYIQNRVARMQRDIAAINAGSSPHGIVCSQNTPMHMDKAVKTVYSDTPICRQSSPPCVPTPCIGSSISHSSNMSGSCPLVTTPKSSVVSTTRQDPTALAKSFNSVEENVVASTLNKEESEEILIIDDNDDDSDVIIQSVEGPYLPVSGGRGMVSTSFTDPCTVSVSSEKSGTLQTSTSPQVSPTFSSSSATSGPAAQSTNVQSILLSIASWSKEEVFNWLKKGKLDSICPNLNNLDGRGLQRMAFEYQRDPELFYTRVKKTLGLSLFQTLVISRSLQSLIQGE